MGHICWLFIPVKGAYGQQASPLHIHSNNFCSPPPFREVLKVHTSFSVTLKNKSHKYRRRCTLSHTQFQKLDTHRNSAAVAVCVLLFLTSFPLFPSTLWKPLLREAKSVISLVVLMHQTFLISGIEKSSSALRRLAKAMR